MQWLPDCEVDTYWLAVLGRPGEVDKIRITLENEYIF